MLMRKASKSFRLCLTERYLVSNDVMNDVMRSLYGINNFWGSQRLSDRRLATC